jgi:hypothetical protein
MLFQFERRHEPIAAPAKFWRRMLTTTSIAFGVIGASLVMGVLGYRCFGHIPGWVDCIYNASMILGGMGPVNELTTSGGKLFASFYALYSGVILLASVGVMLSPALHRLLHYFHLESGGDR